MSKPKMFEKPSGVKDYLPEAASKLRAIEWNVLQCMERWGYRQIITPTLEYYDTVGATSSTANDRLFKLLDNKGTTLVLRSEMTAPIARVVSSLLKDEALPLRLSHHSNVFRAIEEEAGREAEFVQTGVELVGDGSAEADAEVIALAVACLKAAGVREFKIAIGHIGFLNGVLRANLQDRPEDQQALKEFLLGRNYVGYRHYLRGMDISEQAREQLEAILRLRGGQEISEEAAKLALDEATSAAVGHLSGVWQALQVYGVTPHVLIDLTMIGNFSYYTGLIFEGYAEDLGFPVCSGGRYDNLLAQFGRPAPATGFALETNRIVQVAEEQIANRPKRVLVLYTKEHREEAIASALELRDKHGHAVETRYIESALGDDRIRMLGEGRFELDGRVFDEILPFDM
jgi:ATP phosphoribosyltransferase regulatory subunit